MAEKRLIAAQARAAAAWRAWALRGLTKATAWASRLQAVCRSLAVMPHLPIHKRRHLLRRNWVLRTASSMAACWVGESRSVYS